jgi:uncharacterized cupredoxin-like copper-binding protein
VEARNATASAVAAAISEACQGDVQAASSALATAVAKATATAFAKSTATVTVEGTGSGCAEASGSATAGEAWQTYWQFAANPALQLNNSVRALNALLIALLALATAVPCCGGVMT